MCATLTEIINGNWKFLFFSKFKRGNSVKNKHTITKFEFDQRIPTTNIRMQFEPYSCIQPKVREQKLKIVENFSKFKRNNSVKNQQPMTKFELNLRINMTYLHMQFQPDTYIQTKVRERKLKTFSKGITLKKFIIPGQNLNLTYVIV
jgi:hypothetical protein